MLHLKYRWWVRPFEEMTVWEIMQPLVQVCHIAPSGDKFQGKQLLDLVSFEFRKHWRVWVIIFAIFTNARIELRGSKAFLQCTRANPSDCVAQPKWFCAHSLHPSCERQLELLELIYMQMPLKPFMASFKHVGLFIPEMALEFCGGPEQKLFEGPSCFTTSVSSRFPLQPSLSPWWGVPPRNKAHGIGLGPDLLFNLPPIFCFCQLLVADYCTSHAPMHLCILSSTGGDVCILFFQFWFQQRTQRDQKTVAINTSKHMVKTPGCFYQLAISWVLTLIDKASVNHPG